jgi:hypothetical protein
VRAVEFVFPFRPLWRESNRNKEKSQQFWTYERSAGMHRERPKYDFEAEDEDDTYDAEDEEPVEEI